MVLNAYVGHEFNPKRVAKSKRCIHADAVSLTIKNKGGACYHVDRQAWVHLFLNVILVV